MTRSGFNRAILASAFLRHVTHDVSSPHRPWIVVMSGSGHADLVMDIRCQPRCLATL